MEGEYVNIYSMPRIGDEAPDFKAATTTGTVRFSDYNRGRWVIFFSHPADFTPVCTTELSAFTENLDFFDTLNTRLLGLSIDSIHSHLAWINNVKEKTGIYLSFPIIADTDMKVAKLYGMIHENDSSTATVRAVFIMDPDGIIRLIMYFPSNVGRNIEEIKRALVALQTSDRNGCATPANWKEGDQVIVPAPQTLDEMNERIINTEYDKTDFYLARRDLPN